MHSHESEAIRILSEPYLSSFNYTSTCYPQAQRKVEILAAAISIASVFASGVLSAK
jgi:hypothetical protein